MTVRKSFEVDDASDNDLVEFVSNKRQKSDALPKAKPTSNKGKITTSARYLGAPLSKAESIRRWPDRYPSKANKKAAADEGSGSENKRKLNGNEGEQEHEIGECVAHYLSAEVDGCTYELGDCVYVNAGEGPDYIGRIIEFFETADGSCWFTSQWFFRAEDTAVGEVEGKKHDKKRIFCSEVKDNNLLECIVSKIKIIRLSPLHHFNNPRPNPIPPCDYFYDMGYDYAYSRFYKLPSDSDVATSESDLTVCNDVSSAQAASGHSENKSETEVCSGKKYEARTELSLLDLYSGCGGMSTGLCMGASLSGVRLVTKWAVDLNEYACKSLKYNHPETEVRNEAAEDFLALIKEWQKLCEKYCKTEDVEDSKASGRCHQKNHFSTSNNEDIDDSSGIEDGEFEVEKLVGIRYVSSSSLKKIGLEFKVHWKGYGSSEDTWEPLEGLGDCEDSLRHFVIQGKRAQILPLPGGVDVVCGGPPCQGASGFNRFRNKDEPLADVRNKQIVVYMDIVDFLKPRFILMENVVDILKFAGGLLGRYALSRLVQMHYQAKLGLIVAGCYGLPQFRMRVFLWGASPLEKLPPYPLPSHDVVQKGGIPQEWERNVVAYDETQKPKLLRKLTLGDALSDLPAVENSEDRDEMPYGRGAQTEFQWFIRLPKLVLTGECNLAACKKLKMMLYDHRPLQLNTDDIQRTCRIPKEKGANFRDLPGVMVKEDNVVALDPCMDRVLLPSGKPLVPDYAITFVNGRSTKPFGRLWWDETVPTVVTRAEPHNQVILHPEQDRVLTIRENARLQGFPDYYKLFGPVKQRYIQVGNAVAVPVARALGFSLAVAVRRQCCPSGPIMELPPNFPYGLMLAAQHIKEIPLEVEDSM
eukprot:c19462_g1_i1 orf=456-3056(-)